jgi:hypothetical protein
MRHCAWRLALAVGLLLVLPAPTSARSEPGAVGYVTSAPIPDWLGLATLEGREAIQLGDNCGLVVPGVNVVLDADGRLQAIDPLTGLQPQACTLVNDRHMSDVPCQTNPAGACDVAFS